MANTRITVAQLNTRLENLEELVRANVELTTRIANILTSVNEAPVKASAKQANKPAKQGTPESKSSAKAPKKGAKQKKAEVEAPAVVNYGSWYGYCEARRKAAGFGDKWVEKTVFYAKLDELGWEKTHSYRGRFYRHGKPVDASKKADR